MNIPDFTLPKLFGTIGRQLPRWPADQMIIQILNLAIRFNVLPKDALADIEGRTIGFEVQDMGLTTAVTFLGTRFWRAEPESAELFMRANTAQFLQLATRQEDPDTLFFNRTLVVEGDTELGLIVKNLLDSIELDALPALFPFMSRP